MDDFGKTLREIRTKRGYSQEKMAQILGTSKQVLSRYETGLRTPKVTTVADYAEKLGVDISVLAGGDKDEDEIWIIRERLRRQPGMRMLFDATEGATEKDLMDIVSIAEMLKARSGKSDD